MGGLFHLVQQGCTCGPASPLLAVPNVTAHPSTASYVPITVLLYDAPLLCGFNVAIKGLMFLTVLVPAHPGCLDKGPLNCGVVANAYRTWDPCWAEIHIFFTRAIADADARAADVMQTAYSELLKLAVEFVDLIDVGYSDCIVRVASCCQLRYDVMRRLRHFTVIATIPNSVDMAGVGLCDDFIFAKRLQLNDRPVSRLLCVYYLRQRR